MDISSSESYEEGEETEEEREEVPHYMKGRRIVKARRGLHKPKKKEVPEYMEGRRIVKARRGLHKAKKKEVPKYMEGRRIVKARRRRTQKKGGSRRRRSSRRRRRRSSMRRSRRRSAQSPRRRRSSRRSSRRRRSRRRSAQSPRRRRSSRRLSRRRRRKSTRRRRSSSRRKRGGATPVWIKRAKSSVKRGLRRISPKGFSMKRLSPKRTLSALSGRNPTGTHKSTILDVVWDELKRAYYGYKQEEARRPPSRGCVVNDFWQWVALNKGPVIWLDEMVAESRFNKPEFRAFATKALQSDVVHGIDENMKEVWKVFSLERCREWADLGRTVKQDIDKTAMDEWGVSIASHLDTSTPTLSAFLKSLL